MPDKSWLEYWARDEFWLNSGAWKLNADIFLRRSAPWIEFHAADAVLTIGCGAGHLEALLAPRVERIHTVDTSDRYLEICRARCAPFKNVSVQRLGDRYTDLSICPGPFSLILCVSVVQYYRRMEEISELIQSAKSIARPGARMLVADLPRRRDVLGKLYDDLCTMGTAIREGHALTLARDAIALRKVSAYRTVALRTPVLQFSPADLAEIARVNRLNATVIPTSLSAVANRPSLLIQF